MGVFDIGGASISVAFAAGRLVVLAAILVKPARLRYTARG